MHVYLDGKMLHFDTQPLLLEEGIMLPLRAMCEKAGFWVSWDNDLKRATLHGHGRSVALYLHNPLYAVNGVLNRMEHPPLLQDNRLLVCLTFLERETGLSLREADLDKGILHFETGQPPGFEAGPGLPGGAGGVREQPVYFVELLLPKGDRVQVDETFQIRLAAPFVKGIYAYEVSFFYNPEIIRVKDVNNPAYQSGHEFYMKETNNRVGNMRYTLTTLGATDDLPPRDTLAVIEAVVSREGAVPLIEETLKVTLLDYRLRAMPVGLEERVLYVGPAPMPPPAVTAPAER